MRRITGWEAGMAAVVTAFVLALTQGVASAAPEQTFASCEQARDNGFADIPEGSPAYSSALDADGDGIACESAGEESAAVAAPSPTPAEQVPAPPTTAVAAPPAPTAEVQDALAETGGELTIVLAVAAFVLFLMGGRLVNAGYQRLNWLPGRSRDIRFTVEQRKPNDRI